jgi:glutamate/tyrosine decarboxylase-like PLP-dependent enzyme
VSGVDAPPTGSTPPEHPDPSRLLLDAAARAARYLAATDRPVQPDPVAVQGLDGFSAELPAGPVPAAVVLDELDRLGSPATVLSTAGRYFGFVTGGTEPVARAAAVLAGAWDQNVAVPVMSPVAARLDRLAATWAVDLLGLPPGAVATFGAGATVANITAVLTARDALLARAGWDVAQQGLAGAPPLRVVASAEAHVSALRALRVAGIGRDQVVLAPTDPCGRVVPETFPEVDARTLVLLQAGNVNTGHSDPFAELVPRAREAGAWVHVDGAFGLWLNAAPERRHLVAGVELADSWATDGHKWLNVPYDCGITVCADPPALRRSMADDAAYLVTESDRALMHLGLQMSQRARGIEVWAVLASLGRAGVADLVERCCRLASRFADRLVDGGADLLAPVVSNQALVAFGDDARTDAVVAAVQADGTCWAGGTRWHGRTAMRVSVSDRATTQDDVDRSAAAVLRCLAAVPR